MSKRSRLSLFTVHGASFPFAASLLAAVACAGTPDEPAIGGTGGTPANTAGTPANTAGNGTTIPSGGSDSGMTTAGTGNTTAGSATGGTSTDGGSGTTAGTSSGGGSGGSRPNGGAGGGGGGSGGGSGGKGGTGSGGGSGGGASADCSTLKLCDGFEGDAPGKGTSPWKTTGTVEVVTDVFHGGSHSVHIKAASGAAFNANINEKTTFPTTDHWGRVWVQIKATSTEHQMFIGINMSGDQGRLLNRLGSDTPQVNFQAGDKFYAAEVKFTQGMWFCYEWHVTDTATSIYIDGKKQNLKGGTNGDAPGMKGGTALLLGFQRFANGSAGADVWYDDVAIGTSQIGCQ